MRLRAAIALLVGALCLGTVGRAPAAPLILYFDPDVNTKTLGWMQATAQAYFASQLGPVRFQPVTKVSNFERLMRQQRPIAAVIASVYLQGRRTALLSCPLIPERKNRTDFHKVLVTTNPALSLAELKGKSLAAVISGNRPWLVRSVLTPAKLKLADLRVVAVSKDIDALFALSFNQVDLALVNPLTIDVLSKINPHVAKGLRVLFRSKPIRFPLLCFPRDQASSAMAKKIRQAFVSMASHPLGKKALQMMGFDRWKGIPSGTNDRR